MNVRIRTVILLSLCWSTIIIKGTGSNLTNLPKAEAKLAALFAKISVTRTDEENSLIADSVINLLDETLQLPGSFEYTFSQVKTLGKISSPNQKIRIFTWNLPLKDGTNRYFGYILYKTAGDNINMRRLIDQSATINDPDMAALNADNWYGCLIYAVVEKKISGDTYYTLLGYDPENIFTSRKLVDILWFNDKNEPVFGKALFNYNKRMQCRIIFEYAAKVQMSLKWNENMNMIVFDHLSPSKPSYTGNYQYYGPDFSYDGLKFQNEIWEMVENVDVRNSRE